MAEVGQGGVRAGSKRGEAAIPAPERVRAGTVRNSGGRRSRMSQRVRVGVVGCGAISGAYLNGARSFPVLDIVACADLDRTAAERKAKEFGVPRVCPVDELLRDESVDVVLNLTVPKAHVPVALRAVEAGKHTSSAKTLGLYH